MIQTNRNSFLAVIIICFAIFVAQGFAQQKSNGDHKPTNLKILPKDISDEELHKIMKGYAKSLGVRCNFCHEKKDGNPPKMDFAADTKPEKLTARKMMEMVKDINKEYIDKIGEGHFEKVTCVTCHMGNTKPLSLVDSLPDKPREKNDSLMKRQMPPAGDSLMQKPLNKEH